MCENVSETALFDAFSCKNDAFLYRLFRYGDTLIVQRISLALLFLLGPLLLPRFVPAPPLSAGPQVGLRADGDGMPTVEVDGIACDNLRETPAEQRDRLEILLPAGLDARAVSGTVSNPDGTTGDVDGRNNVGTAVTQRDRLYYFPPDEYNRRQEPHGLRDVDGPATRIVLLTVQARGRDGSVTTFAPKRIVLARPPVVMIHGINRGPDCWIAMARAIARLKGSQGRRLEIPSSTLDHYAPPDYAGVNFRDRSRYPAYLYYGSGPVEIGAALLARHIGEVRRRVLAGLPLPANDYGRPGAAPKPFVYRMPGEETGPPVRLAIRRVDLLGWSYGGVIARWYLRPNPTTHTRVPAFPTANAVSVLGKAAGGLGPSYRGAYALPGTDGRQLDLTPSVEYRHDVRKLITLGSMWRGVPIVNCLNEIRFSDRADPEALSRAPVQLPQWMPRALWNKVGADRNIGSFTYAIDKRIRVNTPAMEVMAIDSPWLSTLLYGTPSPDGRTPAAPFRQDVAYGSVAGDNSAYLAFGPLAGISPYGALKFFQQPARFSYLALDQRAGITGAYSPVIGGVGDYTDGLVPLWSAAIPGDVPGASRIVPASHDTFFTDPETLEFTARWLNDAALPTGRVLCPLWNAPVVSRGGRKRWEFREGEMAPAGRDALYGRVEGVGRILPAALYPARSLIMRRVRDRAVRVEWSPPAGGRLRRVTLYEGTIGENGSPPSHLKKLRVFDAAPEAEHPYALLEGLRKDTSYFIIAEAAAPNKPDPHVIVTTGFIEVPVGE